MVNPIARGDELRLDVPAGTVTLRIEGDPIVRLRRPRVGELRRLLERWDELRGECYDLGVTVDVVVDTPLGPVNQKIHRRREGVTDRQVQELTPRWLVDVIETLTDGDTIYETNDLPGWTLSPGVKLFDQIVAHWFAVPLVSGASESGSEPNGQHEPAPTPTAPTMPREPVILEQAILGGPVPGLAASTG